ncbi:MAG: hypothetical protein IBX48_00570 [Thiomicrospira sp.]|uniref:hypothetical protein n=1 Tax=Thiomicrospira sp. TaxID=935 RepID=UPI0019F01252|nr:hypothetical protein [Thiomicrospira sp.]MBE0492812.1 hypothetical protein [Thiomicrospira sp.]
MLRNNLTMQRLIGLSLILLMSGCAQNTKIVVPSYTAPVELSKIEELKSGSETAEGVYLSFAINPDLAFSTQPPANDEVDLLTRNLVNQLQVQITETRFISIHPIYDMASVVLDMEVMDFQYSEQGGERKANLSVTFTLSKGSNAVLAKVYDAQEFRFSSDPNRLPSKQTVLASLTQTAVKKFVTDISPTRTNQLREFLSLPSDLSHVIGFAEKGNFQSAIDDMLKYQGKRDVNFYYNLAVLYEAQGSRSENLNISANAKQAYEQAFRLGGNQNDIIASAKARFDNFYRLLVLTQDQRTRNLQLNQELDEQFFMR